MIAFFTVCVGHISIDLIPEKLRKKYPRHDFPVLHLARMAVDAKHQNNGIGKYMLVHVIQMSYELSDRVGMCGVNCFAQNEMAMGFYEQFGMIRLKDDHSRRHMFIPMRDIRNLLR
ncbi:MAG: GNAT family N-acetyltransferase [Phycisphaeraceae bacterium]|nr:GNAT family N-acetyltransferase [Phycisphaeraceae bacterium]